MPENGIQYVEKSALLSYEEMVRLISVLSKLGIEKIRITGGEPFVRKGMMQFLSTICQIPGIQDVHLTTNGTVTAPLVPELKKIGIKSVKKIKTVYPDLEKIPDPAFSTSANYKIPGSE